MGTYLSIRPGRLARPVRDTYGSGALRPPLRRRLWVVFGQLRMGTGGGGTEPGDEAGARAGQVPGHLQVAGDCLGGACTGALAYGDDRFGEGGGEVRGVWIGGFGGLQKVYCEVLD